MPNFRREYQFAEPVDDLWELIPENEWTFERGAGAARLANRGREPAEIYLRPCSGYGDTFTFHLADHEPRHGRFRCGFLAGFEEITVEIDLDRGELTVATHEYHKLQPRARTRIAAGFSKLSVKRDRDALPGLPYEGSRLTVLVDDQPALTVGNIDYLPESLFMFGLHGPGELTLRTLIIDGPARPRPEYVNVGIWQQAKTGPTPEHVDGLVTGVREAAAAGVEILVTPETSLTGLRPLAPDFDDRPAIQAELRRFQQAVAKIDRAPYTLIGYPEWIAGSHVDGAELPQVKVNCHRFVRPDGSLGPMMAKVHSCEAGLWHGRRYNLQRVAGVEVAVGVCHDGHYQDVWATGVMAGARLCLHPAAGGSLSGDIPSLVAGYRGLGAALCAFWVRVNAGGGSAIVYPARNRKVPETILAVPRDLTAASPTYPNYSTLGPLLATARLRLWDAAGSYPLRTLRNGAEQYRLWSRMIPEIVDV